MTSDEGALTPQEIISLVDRAKRGEGTLDYLVGFALFGDHVPVLWKDWPPAARESWDAAASLYFSSGPVGPRRINQLIPVEVAWKAVLESELVEGPDRLSWADLSKRLGHKARTVSYQLREHHGFRFKKLTNRILVAGPCIICEEVWPIDDLAALICPNCLETGLDTSNDPGIGADSLCPDELTEPPGQD